jgi:hypothetical protein
MVRSGAGVPHSGKDVTPDRDVDTIKFESPEACFYGILR